MTAFVILHYRAIDTTINCVDSIKALCGDKHIIIVDNASPDGTGKRLLERYADDGGVTVLLSESNEGFARGNNIGTLHAYRNHEPDFVVVLNNDVEIPQADFIPKLHEIYNEHPFDLLGPDIVSVFSGIHQNPKYLRGCSLQSVRKKREYVRRSQNPILMLLSSGEKMNPAYWRMLQRRRREKMGIDSSLAAEGVVLHGSCVVFSRRYLDDHPQPFYPKTFMYYEMEILEWLCRQEGRVLRYDPAVSVLHYQYVASKMEYASIMRRSKFVASCLSDSLAAAEELISAYDGAPAHTQKEAGYKLMPVSTARESVGSAL